MREVNSNSSRACAPMGYVAGIKRFMRGDGPGVRSTVFLKGCGLRCLWCSSPQTWHTLPQVVFLHSKCIGCGKCLTACPLGAIRATGHRVDYSLCDACGKCASLCAPKALRFDGTLMRVEEVLDEVLRDASYYTRTGGGVTLSGGEAAVQFRFSAAILSGLKEKGIHTALETCGQVPRENLEALLPLTDIVYFDIKHMDADRHQDLTGQDNRLILQNLELCVRAGSNVVLNLPLIPGCNDSPENLEALASHMRLLGLDRLRVLPFHRLGAHEYEELGMEWPSRELVPQSPGKLARATGLLEQMGVKIVEA